MGRLEISMVRVGMRVDEAVYVPETNQLLLQYGVTLTPRMLELLKQYGIKNVTVSSQDSLFISPSQSLSYFMKNFFHNKIQEIAPDNKEGNINEKMMEIAPRIIGILDQATSNTEILESCVEIKLVNNTKLFYPAIHSCARAVLVAGAMGLDDQQIYNIAGAALIQNLGLCEMPFLLDMPKRLGKYEDLWREHSQYGYYFAKERGIDNEIAKLVLSHHEQFDGSGYPNGLSGDDIPMGSKIINLCSDFDEMLFAKKMQPYQIADQFFIAGDGKYDSRVVDAFIMNIPLYPLGSIVRLSTQEVGVVVNIKKNIGARPLVRICYNRFNKPYTDTKVIDLGEHEDVFIEEILI